MDRSTCRILWWLSAMAICLTLGCIESAPNDVPAESESPSSVAPWSVQVADVRDGKSRRISFTSDAVTPEQWAMLAAGCDDVTVVEVDARNLIGADFEVLRFLTNLSRLKLIGPVGDDALRQISCAQNLTALNLPDGQFTDDGLAALGSLEKLELLRFASPQVTDEGLAIVARLPSLRFLHLIGVPITDAGLVRLHDMTQLESFYLDGGDCTDEGLRRLLRSLPELHFHRDQLHLPDDPRAHPHN